MPMQPFCTFWDPCVTSPPLKATVLGKDTQGSLPQPSASIFSRDQLDPCAQWLCVQITSTVADLQPTVSWIFRIGSFIFHQQLRLLWHNPTQRGTARKERLYSFFSIPLARAKPPLKGAAIICLTTPSSPENNPKARTRQFQVGVHIRDSLNTATAQTFPVTAHGTFSLGWKFFHLELSEPSCP